MTHPHIWFNTHNLVIKTKKKRNNTKARYFAKFITTIISQKSNNFVPPRKNLEQYFYCVFHFLVLSSTKIMHTPVCIEPSKLQVHLKNLCLLYRYRYITLVRNCWANKLIRICKYIQWLPSCSTPIFFFINLKSNNPPRKHSQWK